MSTISRATGWLLTICGVAILALLGTLWFDGTNVVTTAGQAWSEIDPLSLSQTRHLTLSYFGFDAWNDIVGTMLQQPAWLAMAEMAALTLVVGFLFLQFGHAPQTAESEEARPT